MARIKDGEPDRIHDLQVGSWRVEPLLNRIRNGAASRRLEPQVMDLLVFLASRPNLVVSKDEIIDGVWQGRFIAEATLTRSVADLRRALADHTRHPEYIETIPKRGYRLIAAVHPVDAGAVRRSGEADAAGAAASDSSRPSLVVLPFANRGPEDDGYFCEGLTDDVINALARVAGLRVISRTSAFAAHAGGGGVAEIGGRLGVTHAIEGSVRRTEGRVRVTAQLVRISDQCQVWSERYDRDVADVFLIQDEIAAAIARRLELTLTSLLRAGDAPTTNIEAYRLFVEGRHHFLRGTADGLTRARHCLTGAVRLDPSFAVAHDALAEVFWYLGFYGLQVPKEAFTLAVWESLRAIELDERNAEAHALLGMLRKELDYDWSEVNREFARALELNPRSPVVRMRYAICGLIPHGRTAEAAAILDEVTESDPLSIPLRWWLATAYFFGRQLGPMREQVGRMLEIDAVHPLSNMMLGLWQLTEGDPDAAVASLEKASTLAGRPAWLLGWLGLVCGAAGRQDAVRRLHDELQARAAGSYVSPFALALTSLGLGDVDAAFRSMDHAIDVRDPFVVPLLTYPFLDPLRSDPRYVMLLAKMNLPAAAPSDPRGQRPGAGGQILKFSPSEVRW